MKKGIVVLASLGSFAIGIHAEAQSVTGLELETHRTTNISTADNDFLVYTKGKLTASGTGVNGLSLQENNTVTTGTIVLDYDSSAVMASTTESPTEFVLKLPTEFSQLAFSENFKNYIRGNISFSGNEYDYTSEDISIEDNGNVVKFKHPVQEWKVGEPIHATITFDIGQAVTDTGIRIPNVEGSSHYVFESAVLNKDSAVDWTKVTDLNPPCNLATHKLDPGWDLLHQLPTIEPVTDQAHSIIGTGVPGAEIKVEVNGQVIKTGSVDPSGIYTILLDETLGAGTDIFVSQNTGVGWSDKVKTTVIHKGEEIPAPTVNEPVTSKDSLIKGKGTIYGNTIKVINQKTKEEIGNGTVERDGTFSVKIPPQKPYTVLAVTETNLTDTSPATLIVVKKAEGEIPAPIVNEPVTNQDTSVKGQGSTPGNMIKITNEKTKEFLGSAEVQPDGSFSVPIPKQETYTVLAVTETNGTETSPETTVVVHEGIPVQENKITHLDAYSISTSGGWVTGTYEGADVAKMQLIVDGEPEAIVPVQNGEIKYYGGNVINSPSQTVEVQILDASGTPLDKQVLTVTE
jgi:hypothetical protein